MADGAGITPEEMKEGLAGIKLYSMADNVSNFGSAPDGQLFQTAAEQALFLKSNGVIDTVPDVPSLIVPQFVHKAAE